MRNTFFSPKIFALDVGNAFWSTEMLFPLAYFRGRLSAKIIKMADFLPKTVANFFLWQKKI